MKTAILFLVFCLATPFFALSQVGIGTVVPNAQLDIQSSNQATPSITDGLLIPKVDEFPASNPGAGQDGMMVYATGNGTPSQGFYYWNNATTSWVTIVGGNSAATMINELLDGKSDSDGSEDGSSIFLGVNAGSNDDGTDNRNVGIGFNTLNTNISGNGNVAIGHSSLVDGTGNYNIAIGQYAMQNSTTGSSNIGIGLYALTNNTSGLGNLGIGGATLGSNTTGYYNLALGYSAMTFNSTGYANVVVGSNAMDQNQDGYENTVVGNSALVSLISGHRNVAVGADAGVSTLGYGNVFLGYRAGYQETGSNRLYIDNSGADQSNSLIYGEFDNNLLRINGTLNVNGTLNINNSYSFPSSAGSANQVLQYDGAGSLNWVNQNPTGAQMINELSDSKYDATSLSLHLGNGAGNSITSAGNGNVGLGYQALYTNTTGDYNTAIGYQTMYDATGSSNTAVGQQALSQGASGSANAAFGLWASRRNTSGGANSAFGAQALYDNTTGNSNAAFGSLTGRYVNGDNNTFLGSRAGSSSTGTTRNISGSVFIGYSVGTDVTSSNRLYIDNSNTSSPLIYGEFDTNLLRVNGTLNINNAYSLPTTDGGVDQVLQTNGTGGLSWVTPSDNTTSSNGLSLVGDDVRLGGTLTQATTISQGAFNFIHNLNSSGDFIIQDAGLNHFEVRDNGNIYIGGDMNWYDENNSGTLLASLFDLGDDAVLSLNNGGAIQHLLNANGDSSFNVGGMDADFSIQGDNNANLFYVDAGNDRIGIRDATPGTDLYLKQSDNLQAGSGGISFESALANINWKIYHSGSAISFAENGVRRAYIASGTGAYVQTSDRRLKKDIAEYRDVLPKLGKVNVYTYHYLDEANTAPKTLGVMAQQVQPQFPELVSTDESGNLGVNYAGLGVVAIKAIQEQQEIIESQQQQIDALKNEIEQIKQMIKNN